jgi:hypothetical protein
MRVIRGDNPQKMSTINNNIRAILVDPNTGERLGELNHGDAIKRKSTSDFLSSTLEILHDEPYIKTYVKPMFELSKTLSGSEMQMIHFLTAYISYESGMLKHGNGKPVTRGYIADATGMSIKSVDRILHNLRDHQVLGRNVVGREVQYFANPYLFMRGRRINKTLHDMFKNSRWARLY